MYIETQKDTLKVLLYSLISQYASNGIQSGLLNEKQCILTTQVAAKLRDVKVKGSKKMLLASGRTGLTEEIRFFLMQVVIFHLLSLL